MSGKNINKIILFGGGRALSKFAVNVLRSKLKLVIFTEELHLNEKINERGSLKENLEFKNIPYIKCEKISQGLVKRHINDNTLGLSISAVWILKQDFINLFKGRLYNLHEARLPRNRGGGGFTWRILSGDRLGGITIHKLEEGIDAGDMVMQKKFSFPQNCRIPADYYAYLDKKEDEILSEFLKAIKNREKLKRIPQNERISTYWPRLNTRINGFINWEWAYDNIELFVNAFDDPYEGASTFLNNKKVHLKKCFRQISSEKYHPFQAGIVYRILPERIFVAAAGGSLSIGSITDENNKEIKGEIKAGHRFYTPYLYLENAKMARVFYGSKGLRNKA